MPLSIVERFETGAVVNRMRMVLEAAGVAFLPENVAAWGSAAHS